MRLDKKEIAQLILLLIIALIFRLFLLKFRFAIGWDEPHYLQMAVSFAQGDFGDFLHPYWAPMFPAVAGLFIKIIPDYEFAARLASIVMGSLAVPPTYLLARRLFDKKVSLLAALLLALFPPIAFLSTMVLAEPTFMAFAIWGIWLGFSMVESSSYLKGSLVGILFGFAYLTKPEGIGFLITLTLIVVLFEIFLHQKEAKYKQIKSITYYLL